MLSDRPVKWVLAPKLCLTLRRLPPYNGPVWPRLSPGPAHSRFVLDRLAEPNHRRRPLVRATPDFPALQGITSRNVRITHHSAMAEKIALINLGCPKNLVDA